MALNARLKPGESLGDRIMKVVHAGEHGAVNIYAGQQIGARLRLPSLLPELKEFEEHETRHRAIFDAELVRRGVRRCRSYHLCGLGGLLLGIATGLMGERAIAITTVAVERIVLVHLERYREALAGHDQPGFRALSAILADEQAHHDRFTATETAGLLARCLDLIIARSTETVIWLGMRL